MKKIRFSAFAVAGLAYALVGTSGAHAQIRSRTPEEVIQKVDLTIERVPMQLANGQPGFKYQVRETSTGKVIRTFADQGVGQAELQSYMDALNARSQLLQGQTATKRKWGPALLGSGALMWGAGSAEVY